MQMPSESSLEFCGSFEGCFLRFSGAAKIGEAGDQDQVDMILKFNMLMRNGRQVEDVSLPEGQTKTLLSCRGIFKFVAGMRLLNSKLTTPTANWGYWRRYKSISNSIHIQMFFLCKWRNLCIICGN